MSFEQRLMHVHQEPLLPKAALSTHLIMTDTKEMLCSNRRPDVQAKHLWSIMSVVTAVLILLLPASALTCQLLCCFTCSPLVAVCSVDYKCDSFIATPFSEQCTSLNVCQVVKKEVDLQQTVRQDTQ